MLARTENPDQDAPFEMGDLTILPKELRARRGDTSIDLSLRDICILRTLCLNRSKVVDRDALFDACWGQRYVPSSRSLDQHISQLRKRIEADPKNPSLIQTVHGCGYRYE
jgi:DNA-binding response OmpR family regulator